MEDITCGDDDYKPASDTVGCGEGDRQHISFYTLGNQGVRDVIIISFLMIKMLRLSFLILDGSSRQPEGIVVGTPEGEGTAASGDVVITYSIHDRFTIVGSSPFHGIPVAVFLVKVTGRKGYCHQQNDERCGE